MKAVNIVGFKVHRATPWQSEVATESKSTQPPYLKRRTLVVEAGLGWAERVIRSWNDFVAEVRRRIAKALRVVNLRDILMFCL